MSNVKTAETAEIIPTSSALTALHEATRDRLPAKPLTANVAAAWRRLPELYGTVRRPTAERPWTPQEVANAADAIKVARDLRKAAQVLEAAVREGALITIDLDANKRAAVDPEFKAKLDRLPRDKDGHYILGEKNHPAQMPIPGTTQVFSAEYTVGKENLSLEGLEELVAKRAISRRTFWRLTRKVRVIDTEAVSRETSRDISLRERLRGGLKRSASSITINVRDAEPAAI